MRRSSSDSPLTADDRRFLAAIVHRVWRACQAFVTVAVERGPAAATAPLEELGDWAAAQRRLLARRRTRAVSTTGLRVGRDLLEDVDAICRRVGHIVAALDRAAGSEQAEEEALALIEGVVSWTSLMASQLGISAHLRPQILEFEG
jgi:hypothetical protein